jgi:hypothetical protein
MKRKNFIGIALLVALVGIGVWWMMRLAAEAPAKTAGMAAQPGSPRMGGTPTTTAPVNSGIAPPSPNPVASLPLPTSAPDTSGDPQADLKTAIPDIARLWKAGDLVTFYEKYTPPDLLDPVYIQEMKDGMQKDVRALAQDPQAQLSFQESNEENAKTYENLEFQTPTLNATGDKATYIYTMPGFNGAPARQMRMVFIKINGKWYNE